MTLDPKFNKLPKVTDFGKASAVFQQSYEEGFRTLTGQELVSEIKDFIEITGVELAPISSGALITPSNQEIRTMEVVGVGPWTHPTLPGGSVSMTSVQKGKLFWNKEAWSLRNVVDFTVEAKELQPISDGALPAITTTGQDYKMSISGGLNGATFTDSTLPGGQAVLTNKEIGLMYFDGGTRKWSLKNKQELPQTPTANEFGESEEISASQKLVTELKETTDSKFGGEYLVNDTAFFNKTPDTIIDSSDYNLQGSSAYDVFSKQVVAGQVYEVTLGIGNGNLKACLFSSNIPSSSTLIKSLEITSGGVVVTKMFLKIEQNGYLFINNRKGLISKPIINLYKSDFSEVVRERSLSPIVTNDAKKTTSTKDLVKYLQEDKTTGKWVNLDLSSFTSNNGYIASTDFTLNTSTNNYKYRVIPVNAGDILRIKGFGVNVSKPVLLFDNNTTFNYNTVLFEYGTVANNNGDAYDINISNILYTGYLIINNREATGALTVEKYDKTQEDFLPHDLKLLKGKDVSKSIGFSDTKVINEKTFYGLKNGFDFTNFAELNYNASRQVDKFYNASTNVFSTSTVWESYLLPVSVGVKVHLEGFNSDLAYPAVLFSSNVPSSATRLQNYGSLATGNGIPYRLDIEITQNGYLLINNRKATGGVYIYTYAAKNIVKDRILAQADLNKQAQLNVLKSTVISDWKNETMAHCASMYVNSRGKMYLAYYAAANTFVETWEINKVVCKLNKLNVCDWSVETVIDVMKAGDRFGNFENPSIGVSPYDPIIFPYTGVADRFLYLNSARNTNDISEGYILVGRTYNTVTDVFVEDNLLECTLKYQFEGNPKTVKLSAKGLTTMTTDTQGYTPSKITYPIPSIEWAEHEGWYYNVFGGLATNNGEGISGILLRTQNGIDYELVSYIPTGLTNMWEGACVKHDGKMVVTIRNKNNLFLWDLDTKTWMSTADVMVSQQQQRHTIFFKNGRLFLIYNVRPNMVVDGVEVFRSKICISELSLTDYSVINTQFLETPYSFQYYGVTYFNGVNYIFFTEDRRKQLADRKGNISLMLLDDLIKI